MHSKPHGWSGEYRTKDQDIDHIIERDTSILDQQKAMLPEGHKFIEDLLIR
jgi:hypothetical protein